MYMYMHMALSFYMHSLRKKVPHGKKTRHVSSFSRNSRSSGNKLSLNQSTSEYAT